MELHLSVFWFFFLGVCAVNCTEYVSGTGLRYCGYLDTESFSMKTYYCYHKMKFLCRNGNDLTAFRSNATWYQAREKCLLLGGDLFYLRDETKEMPYEHFTGLIKSAMNKSQIPIGEALHIGAHGLSWQWLNGDPIVSYNWYSRTPNPIGLGYTCLAVTGGGSWKSHDCDKEYRAFCQNIDIPLETGDTRGDVVVQLDPLSPTPETNNASRESEKNVETQQKNKEETQQKNNVTQQRNNLEIQHTFLNEVIVAGTLAGVFFLGCVILATILTFNSRKIGLKREEDHRQATRRDTDTYDHINPAAPHYLHPPTPSIHESQDQPRQDEQEPRSEGYSYTYVEPEAEARPSARHQYLEMM